MSRGEYSVLVVDDLEASRYALSRALRAEGFSTVEAANGAQALEMAEFVSAMVLDVHLPDLHGLEVCRLVRSRPGTARLPIIQVSAMYVTDEDVSAGHGSGADGYMLAPIDPVALANELERLILARAGAA